MRRPLAQCRQRATSYLIDYELFFWSLESGVAMWQRNRPDYPVAAVRFGHALAREAFWRFSTC